DPNGRWYKEFITGQQSWTSFYGELGDAADQLGQQSPAWNFAFDHPYTTGAGVGIGSGAASHGLSAALTAASVDALSGIGTRSMGNLSRLESLPQTLKVPGKLEALSKQTGKSVEQISQRGVSERKTLYRLPKWRQYKHPQPRCNAKHSDTHHDKPANYKDNICWYNAGSES